MPIDSCLFSAQELGLNSEDPDAWDNELDAHEEERMQAEADAEVMATAFNCFQLIRALGCECRVFRRHKSWTC